MYVCKVLSARSDTNTKHEGADCESQYPIGSYVNTWYIAGRICSSKANNKKEPM
jgi:hypothetical protein